MLTQIFRCFSAAIAILYTAVTIGLSYASVRQEPEDAPAISAEVSSADETTVHILQSREDISFDIQQAFDLYSMKLPEKTQFSIQTVSGDADYRSTLRAKLLSGEGVDLFHISGARELLELKDHISELDFLPWVSTAVDGSLDAVTLDGRIFGVPYSIEATGFICNIDVFEAAGIPLAEIRSFEALSEAFAGLNDKITTGELGEDFAELEVVCEFPAQDKNFLGGEFADIALSGAFDSPDKAAVSPIVSFPASESVEELIKLIARFSSSRSDWSQLASVTQSRQIERLANGNVAVILADTNVYQRINELNPKLKGRIFLAPIPLYGFEQSSVYAGPPVYWALSATSSEKAKNFTGGFLTWLYCSDDGAEYLANRFMAVSPFRDTAKSTGVLLHSQMLSYLEAGMSLPRLHKEFPHGCGRDVFAFNIQSYFTQREKTWEDVIKSIENGWSG